MTRVVALAWTLRLLTAAGLGVDAGIHADLAPSQPPNGQINQVALFWFEAAVASLAAVLVLATAVRRAHRFVVVVYVFAFLVAASALGAVLLYRYVDVGPLGPLPDMYEPFWYASKIATAVAEALAVVGAAAGIALSWRSRSSRPEHRTPNHAAPAR